MLCSFELFTFFNYHLLSTVNSFTIAWNYTVPSLAALWDTSHCYRTKPAKCWIYSYLPFLHLFQNISHHTKKGANSNYNNILRLLWKLAIIWNKCNNIKAFEHQGTTAPMKYAVLRADLLKIQVLWDVALCRRTSILKDCSKGSLTLKMSALNSFQTSKTTPERRITSQNAWTFNNCSYYWITSSSLFTMLVTSPCNLKELISRKMNMALKTSLHWNELNLILPVLYGVSLFIKVYIHLHIQAQMHYGTVGVPKCIHTNSKLLLLICFQYFQFSPQGK